MAERIYKDIEFSMLKNVISKISKFIEFLMLKNLISKIIELSMPKNLFLKFFKI